LRVVEVEKEVTRKERERGDDDDEHRQFRDHGVPRTAEGDDERGGEPLKIKYPPTAAATRPTASVTFDAQAKACARSYAERALSSAGLGAPLASVGGHGASHFAS
jgi:hypothetical protein